MRTTPRSAARHSRSHPGETTVTVRVAIADDSDDEPDETFTVTLGNASHATIATATATGTIEDNDEPGLTARFESVPASHDGSTPFMIELQFSEEIRISYRTVRDAVLEVSGGRVTRAQRLQKGSNIGWRLTIEPNADADITIALPADRACNATGGVCTADGTRLSRREDATVPGPASEASRVSIAPATNTGIQRSQASNPVTEGASAGFTLARTGDTMTALTVNVTVVESAAMLAGTPPTTASFEIGSATAELSIATEDDEVAEAASEITATLATGNGYSMDSGAASATVAVQDDDAAPAVTTVSPLLAAENGVAIATLQATDVDTPAANLAWSVAGGSDGDKVTLNADGVLAFKAARDFEAPDDADEDGDYEITVRVTDGANPVDAALTVRLTDVDEIAPTLANATVDGSQMTVAFSEALDESSSPAASAFVVAVDGTGRAVSDVSVGGSTVTLTLASAVAAGETVTVGYTAPTGANANPIVDAAGNPAAEFSGQAVTNNTAAPSNTAPTGLPTISGTAQVGETLTASAAGIADADGLANATYTWQWIANDGSADSEISGATSATYTLTAAETGKTVKVRVTFTDDGGTEEMLVSAATGAVAPAPTVAPAISTPGPFTVDENTTAVATLAATDADTAPADLAWSIDGGVDAGHFALTSGGVLAFAAAKNFEVPDDDGEDGTYDVIVAVTDGADRATAALAVTLVNVNEAPVADAGPDRSGIREGTQVTLDGSASSDPDAGDAPTWQWTQTDSSGHAVTLSDPVASGPSFAAPSDLDADTTLEFKLQVTDAAGLRSEDRVTVTVTARPTIAIRPAAAYAKEGEDAVYKLTRTGSADVTLTVLVGVSERRGDAGNAASLQRGLPIRSAGDGVADTDRGRRGGRGGQRGDGGHRGPRGPRGPRRVSGLVVRGRGLGDGSGRRHGLVRGTGRGRDAVDVDADAGGHRWCPSRLYGLRQRFVSGRLVGGRGAVPRRAADLLRAVLGAGVSGVFRALASRAVDAASGRPRVGAGQRAWGAVLLLDGRRPRLAGGAGGGGTSGPGIGVRCFDGRFAAVAVGVGGHAQPRLRPRYPGVRGACDLRHGDHDGDGGRCRARCERCGHARGCRRCHLGPTGGARVR